MSDKVVIKNCTLYNCSFEEIISEHESKDLVIVTDPPYGIGFKYNSHEDTGGEDYIKMIEKLSGKKVMYNIVLLQYPE